MSRDPKDLWGDISGVTSEVTPVSILREQADLLRDKTQGVVEGEIVTRTEEAGTGTGSNAEEWIPEESKLIHMFLIRAPKLDNYRYVLLSVEHDLSELYPLTVHFHPTDEWFPADEEQDFLDVLARQLKRHETQRVIGRIIAQINPQPPRSG